MIALTLDFSCRRRWSCAMTMIVVLGIGGCTGTAIGTHPPVSSAIPQLAPTGVLTRDVAVNWALTHDPAYLALVLSDELEALDIRRQGRLHNPGITLGRLTRGGDTEIDRGLDLDLLGLLTLPTRMALSDRELARAGLDARIRLLQRQLAISLAWIDAVAAVQRARYAEDVDLAAQAAQELASRMRKAGTLNALDEGRERAFALESGVSLRMARAEARQAREKLALLMGVADPEALMLPDQLPPLPDVVADDVSADTLMKERLDILSVRAETDTLARSLRLGKATRVVNVLELGLQSNSETGQPRQHGQSLRLELPLFDAGVSRVREADLRYRRALELAAARALAVQQEWRQAQAGERDAWGSAKTYHDELIPLQKRLMDETLLRYNGMLADTFEVLAQSREQIRTLNAGLDAQAAYWRAAAVREHVRFAPLPRGES